MGGTVGETIRRENGEVIKMARKTGAYDWMFFSKEFCEKKFDIAIDKHIKTFVEMREDYLKGEPYKYNMTPVYGWCEVLCPIDYGLVVIDFQKKKIHSMQGYSNPGHHYISMLSNNVILNKDTEFDFDYLIKNNLLLIKDDGNEDKDKLQDIKEFFGEDFSLKKLRIKLDNIFTRINSVFNYKNSLNNLLFFPKVLNEFEFIMYEETPEGTISFLKNLIEDGFSFTKNDFDGWKDKINNFDVDYFLTEKDYEIDADDLIEKAIKNNREKIIQEILELERKSLSIKSKF